MEHTDRSRRIAMFVYNVCTADPRVLKEAGTLAAVGHQVTVIAIADGSAAAEEKRDGFRIVRIQRDPPHLKLLRLLRTIRRVLRRIRRAPHRVLRVINGPREPDTIVDPVGGRGDPCPGQRAPSAHPSWRQALMYFHKPLMFGDYYVRAVRAAQSARPDAVHAHDLNTLPAAAAIAWSRHVPLVYDAHELYTEMSTLSRRERRLWRGIERALIGRANHVVTVCESIADELAARYGIDKPKVVLNCPPRPATVLSRERGLLRQRVGLEDSAEPIVLYQGRFSPHRGLEELVEAAAHFRRGVLVLMGWGVLEPTLAYLVTERGLEDRVLITGPVPQEDLLSYTVGADVGVIPYKAVGLNNYYTTPNKLFEYMAAGVPIAGSRFPEIIRFVEDLDLGRTFDPRNPRDIATAINAVLSSDSAHAAMCERVRMAAQRFTWELQTGPLIAIYGPDGAHSPRPRPAARKP